MQTVSPEALPALTATILWSAFALAFVFGAVAQRTGFCTMGAIADVVTFRDATRLRQWLLAVAVATLATQWMAAAGVIDPTKSIYTGARFTLLAYVLGGFLFGFGMVLAGGCGSRTLVRVGGGSLKSLVVAIVLGLAAFVTLRGVLALPRVNVIEPVGLQLAAGQDLPSLLARAGGLDRATAHVLLGTAIGGVLLAVVFWDRAFWRFDNLLAGIGIGAVIGALWFVSGHLGHLAEHPLTLEETFVGTATGKMESLSFVAPVAQTLDWLMFWSDTSKVLTLGGAAVLGTVAGSALVALWMRRFRWEGFRDTEDTAHHIVGAVLMGFGGITALGCTVGQGLSGVSTLALGSYLAWAAIIVGAATALKYLAWKLERDATSV